MIMISIFILTYGIFFYSNTQTKNERIEFDLNKQIKGLKTHYDLTMTYFLIDVKSIRNNISNNQKAINIFSQAQNACKEQKNILRDELYKMLNPMYKRIRSRGILYWQFVFPDNISFLRMHKPNKYGDDLTDIRYSFNTSNKTKETVIKNIFFIYLLIIICELYIKWTLLVFKNFIYLLYLIKIKNV